MIEQKTTNVVEIKPESKKKTAKVRFEPLIPTMIIDVWRVVEKYLLSKEFNYPDLSEETPEALRSWLLAKLLRPEMIGIVARVGRRPVAVVWGYEKERAYGLPKKYLFIHGYYVDPAFRKSGIGLSMWDELILTARKKGIYYWESNATPELTAQLVREQGVPIKKLMDVIGGKFT